MDLQLIGKRAFISGSTAGIGNAVAKWLIKEGVHVIINGRTQTSVDTAIDKIISEIPKASVSGIATDFTIKDEVNTLCNQLSEIDILINNVGIYTSKPYAKTKDSDWYEQHEVNVMSGVRLSRKCLPDMMSKNWGRIIFVSSECASLVPTDMISYSSTKAAMHAIARGLSQMTKGTNVTVNTVMPGSTMTEGAEQFLQGVAAQKNISTNEVATDFFTDVRTTSLLQRFATVDEIASTICYLASPLASATNGAVIKLEGGSTGGIM